MKTAIDLIAEERKKQIKNGKTLLHDSQFTQGELIKAAFYAITLDEGYSQPGWENFETNAEQELHDPLANLIKAGALIAAEIDRVIAKNV